MPKSFAKPALPFSAENASADEMLLTLFATSLSGILLLKPVLGADNGDDPVDFTIHYVNPSGQQMLNLPERPDQTLLTLFPSLVVSGVFDFYIQFFKSGEHGRFDISYQFDGLDNFFQLSAQRCGQLLQVNFTDTAFHERSEVEKALRKAQANEQMARAEADLQRQRLESIFMQAPALICIFEGPNHVFKLVNPPYQKLVGDRPIVGKPIAEAMPELKGQPIFSLLDDVYRTGNTFYAHEMMVQLDHENRGNGSELGQNYYNFIYQAIRNLNGEIDGVLVFAYEVTTQVTARKEIEISHKQIEALNKQLKQLNQELEDRVIKRTQALQLAQNKAEWQQERLEHLFMQAPAAICILNGPNLVYELVNPAYQQLFPGRQLLNKPILEALPEIEHNPVYKTFQEVYTTGVTHEEQSMLIPLVREDGVLENRYFKYIQQASINEQGEIDGVLVFAFEITEQVEASRVFEANARQLKLITNALPVLIGYLDKEEKYRFANQAYKAWFNQDPEALLGRWVGEVVGEKAYSGVKQYIDRALTGERVDFEASMPYREGFHKHIRTSYVPDVKEGQVVGFYTMVNDITEQVEARKAVEKSVEEATAMAERLAMANTKLVGANEQLTQVNIDLDNFVYTASHDLKAPILNIEGLMQAMLKHLPAESQQSHSLQKIIALILESVQRFKQTIGHLTEITKLQKENSFEASPVNIEGLIYNVILDLEPIIEAEQAEIQIDVAECPTIRFSEKNLRSIIYNLLSNAIKYRSPDQNPLVYIHCYETPEHHVLSVQDNGLGIDASQQHKLFTMFQRLHNHVEGTGIGLYMVKKIIDNGGGKIEVQSEVGKGSEFKVYFPISTS
jgi:two-component system, sensor histidine kinase